jgi:hypothetical protein
MMTLNDKELVKVVKQGYKNRLFLQEHEGVYYVSDTYSIFKIYPGLYPKTMQELAKVFLGLPEEGSGKTVSIRDKMRTDESLNLVEMMHSEQFSREKQEHELTITDFILKRRLEHRVVVNNEFALVIQDMFAQVVTGLQLYGKGKLDPVMVYDDQDQPIALILPIKFEDRRINLDKFIEVVVAA